MKTTLLEDNLTGRQACRKTSSQEDDLTERQPQRKRNSQEDEFGTAQPQLTSNFSQARSIGYGINMYSIHIKLLLIIQY